jgi:hypothetical protein
LLRPWPRIYRLAGESHAGGGAWSHSNEVASPKFPPSSAVAASCADRSNGGPPRIRISLEAADADPAGLRRSPDAANGG